MMRDASVCERKHAKHIDKSLNTVRIEEDALTKQRRKKYIEKNVMSQSNIYFHLLIDPNVTEQSFNVIEVI